jgi:hypothetical protein
MRLFGQITEGGGNRKIQFGLRLTFRGPMNFPHPTNHNSQERLIPAN